MEYKNIFLSEHIHLQL